jgi:hypothetical protein
MAEFDKDNCVSCGLRFYSVIDPLEGRCDVYCTCIRCELCGKTEADCEEIGMRYKDGCLVRFCDEILCPDCIDDDADEEQMEEIDKDQVKKVKIDNKTYLKDVNANIIYDDNLVVVGRWNTKLNKIDSFYKNKK